MGTIGAEGPGESKDRDINKPLTCTFCGRETPAFPCASCGASAQNEAELSTSRDETAEGRDRAADLRDVGAEERDVRSRQEHEVASAEDEKATAQDQAWSDDDQASSGRDQWNADEDQRAADDDLAAGGSAEVHSRGFQARERSRRQRGAVSMLREDTSTARALEERTDDGREHDLLLGRRDRAMAAGDRSKSAEDRKRSAGDRAEALRNSDDFAIAAERAIETLESMSDAFFTLDSEWRFTYLNPQTEGFLPRSRMEMIGRIIWEEFPEMIDSRFEHEYRRAVHEQIPVRFEQAYESLGQIFEVRAYPVPSGLAVYFTDVTQERLRDERLRQSERLETLGQLTAGIAHDFRNILAAVSGFAQLGLHDAKDETHLGYFNHIAEASRKAEALTNQLLAFARRQDLSPSPTDINEVVNGLASLLHQLMPPDITIHLALSPDPVVVFVDRSQLEQVVLNLVVNSRDAIGTSGLITISTATEDPMELIPPTDERYGWVTVTDDGSGIPDHVLPHIFDPFYSTKPKGEGSGLGLATIYGIVTQSGGSAFVESTPGQGTVMRVALPAEPPKR